MNKRIILHLDMDAFFAQVEERENPQFRGKPIVVGADPKGGIGRGVVATANYEARKYGIHSAMPISLAWQRCPSAIFLPVNGRLYQQVSEQIMEIVASYALLLEILSLDEAYLDISFCKNYKRAEELAKRLKEEILMKEKLTCTIGIGANKLVAKIACAQAKPNGLLTVQPSRVESFLGPLDIEELPGVGEKNAEVLHKYGITTIQELKNFREDELKNIFGKVGGALYRRARGIDEDPVKSEREIKSISREHTFEQDTNDGDILFAVFDALGEEVCAELRQKRLLCKTIGVICRFVGFDTHTKDQTLSRPTDNSLELQKAARRLLLKNIVKNPKPLRLIGFRCKVVDGELEI